jgi:hypothetical protein
MTKILSMIVVVLTPLYLCQPGHCFTQADCDKLAKVQADSAGRQMVEKMRADARGSCLPEPPVEKETKAPPQKWTPPSARP